MFDQSEERVNKHGLVHVESARIDSFIGFMIAIFAIRLEFSVFIVIIRRGGDLFRI